jgi:hypothetical protein
MLGKKSGLTYEMVRERYEHFRARCVKDLNAIRFKTRILNKTMKKQYKMNEKGCIEPLYGKKTKMCSQNRARGRKMRVLSRWIILRGQSPDGAQPCAALPHRGNQGSPQYPTISVNILEQSGGKKLQIYIFLLYKFVIFRVNEFTK